MESVERREINVEEEKMASKLEDNDCSSRRGRTTLRKSWKSFRNMVARECSRGRSKSRSRRSTSVSSRRGAQPNRTEGGSCSTKQKSTPNHDSRKRSKSETKKKKKRSFSLGRLVKKPGKVIGRRHSFASDARMTSMPSSSNLKRSNSLSGITSAVEPKEELDEDEQLRLFIEAVCADPTANIPNPFTQSTSEQPTKLVKPRKISSTDGIQQKPKRRSSFGSGKKATRTKRKSGERNVIRIKVPAKNFSCPKSPMRVLQKLSRKPKSHFISKKAEDVLENKPKEIPFDEVESSESNIFEDPSARPPLTLFELCNSSLFSDTGWEKGRLDVPGDQ